MMYTCLELLGSEFGSLCLWMSLCNDGTDHDTLACGFVALKMADSRYQTSINCSCCTCSARLSLEGMSHKRSRVDFDQHLGVAMIAITWIIWLQQREIKNVRTVVEGMQSTVPTSCSDEPCLG